MAEFAYPFDAGSGAAVDESQWQAMARRFRQTGVIDGSLNKLAVSASGASLSVSVASGDAFVEGFFYRNDAAKAMTIATANASNPRIDTVVVRLDRTANTAVLAVVTGTPAASPAAPTLSQTDTLYELPLANVTVPAAAGVIVSGNVADRRLLTQTFDSAAYVKKAGGDTIAASAAAVVPLVVKGASSQTAALLEARDSAGTVLAHVNAVGHFTSRGLTVRGNVPSGLGTATVSGVQLIVSSEDGGDTTVPLRVTGAVSQAANLVEFTNSAGTVLARVSPAGAFAGPDGVPIAGPAQTAAPVAGTGGAIPGAPDGWIRIDVNGVKKSIPYWPNL